MGRKRGPRRPGIRCRIVNVVHIRWFIGRSEAPADGMDFPFGADQCHMIPRLGEWRALAPGVGLWIVNLMCCHRLACRIASADCVNLPSSTVTATEPRPDLSGLSERQLSVAGSYSKT